LGNSLALAVTQAEPESRPPAVLPTTPAGESDRSEEPRSLPPTGGTETLPAEKAVGEVVRARAPVAPPATPSVPIAAPPTPIAPAGTSVFTTVEEDIARQREQQSRPWSAALAPLVGLTLVVGAIAGLALYLFRPLTADQLYAVIATHIEADDADSVRDEIGEFIERFPNDSRTPKLQEQQQRIDLDRMHRRLLLQARRGGLSDPSLLPVEVLYLEAMNAAQSSPEAAIAKLESLVRLYGTAETGMAADATKDAPTGTSHRKQQDTDERRALCVQLAVRQLELLRDDLTRQVPRQLAAVRERLAAADRLAETDPRLAAEMYRAIIDLYGDRAWAAEVVAEAQQRLEEPTQRDKETGRQGDKETRR
jgi:hypothetical protein